METGILALIIILSLFLFLGAFSIVIFTCFRFRRQRSTSRMAARIGRMQVPPSMDDYGSQRDWDANDLSDGDDDEELQAVDEFGTRRGKNKLVQQYSDGLGSINKDGTRSFLNGWFGLDTGSSPSRETSRASRLKREEAIANSLPRQQNQIPGSSRDGKRRDSVSSDEGSVKSQNELGETEEEEYDRLAA